MFHFSGVATTLSRASAKGLIWDSILANASFLGTLMIFCIYFCIFLYFEIYFVLFTKLNVF